MLATRKVVDVDKFGEAILKKAIFANKKEERDLSGRGMPRQY